MVEGEDGKLAPRRLGSSLDQLARSLGAPGADALAAVFEGWEGLVGTHVAEHCRPATLSQGVLVVHADHPAWAAEMRYGSEDLQSRIAQLVGAGAVARIDVRVRPHSR